MSNDPYAEIVGMMRKEGEKNNAPVLSLATVMSVVPIEIKLHDRIIRRHIYVNPLLLETIDMYELFSSITDFTELDPPLVDTAPDADYTTVDAFQSIMRGRIITFLTEFHDIFRLKVGDTVAVQQVGETFVILSKVVKAA